MDFAFRPPPGLAGPHAQTIAGSLPLRSPSGLRELRQLRSESQPRVLELSAARLMGYYRAGTRPDRGLVVLLHGWEGSADARYILSLAMVLGRLGYGIFRLNFRDHGGTHALNEELFHSCRIGEVAEAVSTIAQVYSPARLALVGFSLGGNFALRVGARARAADLDLRKIIAISPVLHPPATMYALETGFWVYRRYYLRRWRKSLEAKAEAFPSLYRFGDLRRFRTLTETTDFFVREYTEFASTDEYLNGYSILGNALDDLAVPSRIIAAADDPIIPSADYTTLVSRPSLETTLFRQGGHCGFVASYGLRSKVETMIADELQAS